MTWGLIGAAAIGGGTALATNDWGGDSEGGVASYDTRNEDQKKIDAALSSWISTYLPQFEPGKAYTGSLSAPMSSAENTGMNFLNQYLTDQAKPGANALLDTSGKQLMDTMTGSYDPSTSAFYKATRDAAAVNQKTAQNQINAQTGSRNKFFSSEALNEGQQLQTNTTNFLNQTLASLTEKERERKLTAAGMAPAQQIAQSKAAITPIAAATTFGALPRELEQSSLEREYRAWLNQRSEMALPVQAATGTYGRGGANETYPQVQGQSTFDWGSFLGDAAQQIPWASIFGSGS